MRLSFSKLSDFEICPRKFALTYIAGYPVVANKAMEAGRRIHEILYLAVQQDDWKGYLRTNKDYAEFKPMIENFIAYQEGVVIPRIGTHKPKHAEIKFHDKDFDFSGVIDRVDEKDGMLLITDYKSDAKPEADKHDRQLFLYAHFFKKHHPQLNVTHVAPFFLKAHKSIKTKAVTEERLREAVTWLRSLKADIESRGQDIKKYEPIPNKFCRGCTHYLAGRCKEGSEFVAKSERLTEIVEE